MEVHYNLDNLPNFTNAVLTIGTFDGVHHGHRAIIKQVIDKAKEIKGVSVLMTFDPHPRKVVFPNDNSLRLISTLDEKIKLLEGCGLDHLVVVPFTVEFSQISPYVYTEKILVEKLKAKHIIIGYDHRFGLNRGGDINLLKAYAEKGLFTLDEIPEQEIDNLKVSSSKIRKHLTEGAIEKANKQLRHPFLLTGKIEAGLKLAGALGYPTANIKISNIDKLIPAHGTYAATCILNGEEYNGMVYIGLGKTLQTEHRLSVEMNIFHTFQDNFYGEDLEIHLLKYIRPDQVFKDVKELLYNIHQDKTECENYFKLHHSSSVAEVTIAILNWNGRKHLETYIESLKKSYEGTFEIAVIDNGSSDGSVNYLKENHPEVRLILLDKNYGFAGGYNEGLKCISTKYIALVNSDIRGTDNWLTPLIKRLKEDERLAALQPKILSDVQPDYYEYAGAAGGYLDSLGYPFCKGRIFDTIEKDNKAYNSYEKIFWATGAAIVVKTEIFNLVGGFDRDFFAHMEEIDLCWRFKKAGFEISVEPASTVYHLGGGTLSYDSPRKTFLNFRNNWWMLLKNETRAKLIWLIPFRFILDWAFGFLNILKGKMTLTTIAKAHLAVAKSTGQIKAKRKELAFAHKRYNRRETTTGRINVWLPFRYFLMNQKTYRELS